MHCRWHVKFEDETKISGMLDIEYFLSLQQDRDQLGKRTKERQREFNSDKCKDGFWEVKRGQDTTQYVIRASGVL